MGGVGEATSLDKSAPFWEAGDFSYNVGQDLGGVGGGERGIFEMILPLLL